MDDKKLRFTNCINGLAGYFDKKVEPFLLEIYWKALKKHSIEDIEQGAFVLIATVRFFPKVVEWIEAMSGGAGKIEDIAEIQAVEVLRAVKRIGVYNSVKFDDPVSIAVVQLCYGGWIRLCTELMSDGEKWFLKDFVKYYRAYKRQNILSHDVLSGLIEYDNSEKYPDFIPGPLALQKC